MKLLLDENQSPVLVGLLAEAGHDPIHVRDLDMQGSPGVSVLASARNDQFAEDLQSGAVVVPDDDRVRIRSLPLRAD